MTDTTPDPLPADDFVREVKEKHGLDPGEQSATAGALRDAADVHVGRMAMAAARESWLQARIDELEDRITAAWEITDSYSGHAEIDAIRAALSGDTTEAGNG